MNHITSSQHTRVDHYEKKELYQCRYLDGKMYPFEESLNMSKLSKVSNPSIWVQRSLLNSTHSIHKNTSERFASKHIGMDKGFSLI